MVQSNRINPINWLDFLENEFFSFRLIFSTKYHLLLAFVTRDTLCSTCFPYVSLHEKFAGRPSRVFETCEAAVSTAVVMRRCLRLPVIPWLCQPIYIGLDSAFTSQATGTRPEEHRDSHDSNVINWWRRLIFAKSVATVCVCLAFVNTLRSSRLRASDRVARSGSFHLPASPRSIVSRPWKTRRSEPRANPTDGESVKVLEISDSWNSSVLPDNPATRYFQVGREGKFTINARLLVINVRWTFPFFFFFLASFLPKGGEITFDEYHRGDYTGGINESQSCSAVWIEDFWNQKVAWWLIVVSLAFARYYFWMENYSRLGWIFAMISIRSRKKKKERNVLNRDVFFFVSRRNAYTRLEN